MLKVLNLSTISNDTGATLLDKVSFEVGEKEIHCLLGKNGSGKTTLAYAIMGLNRSTQSSGLVQLGDKDISGKKPYERARLGITLAFQEPARFEGISVKDYLSISRKDKKSAVDAKELERVLELVGLDKSFLSRKLDEKLSGGERKRIELASVIMMKPQLMILDEPDASLDIVVYNELYDLLLKIREELQCSILLITHREEAGLIADKATLLHSGKVVASGRFRAVMRQYCQSMGIQDKCLHIKRMKLK